VFELSPILAREGGIEKDQIPVAQGPAIQAAHRRFSQALGQQLGTIMVSRDAIAGQTGRGECIAKIDIAFA
jgi:hypothetical protein